MKPTDKIHPDWKPLIGHLMKDERFGRIRKRLTNTEYFPKGVDIFNVLSLSPNKVKGIIIGMSPDKYVSNGLAFATDGRNTNSLLIIHEALAYQYNDISVDKDSFDNTLSHWTEQGVLLLNASLTAPKIGDNTAHSKYWKWFINGILEVLANKEIPTALVGSLARQLTVGHDKVIRTCHPLKTYYEYYNKSCIWNKINYESNFREQNMFLWFDEQTDVKWLK